MKKIGLFLSFLISCSVLGFGTTTTVAYEIPHPVTGAPTEYSVTYDDVALTWTITVLGNTRVFSESEYLSAAYLDWIIEIIMALFPSSGAGVFTSAGSAASPASNTFCASSFDAAVMSGKLGFRLFGRGLAREGEPKRDDGDAAPSDAGGLRFTSLTPNLSYYTTEAGTLLHAAAGVSVNGESASGSSQLTCKPWANLISSSTAGSDPLLHYGVDFIAHKTGRLGTGLEAGAGANCTFGMVDSAESSRLLFNGGGQFDFDAYFGRFLLSGGASIFSSDVIPEPGGYVKTDLSFGVALAAAVSRDFFVSAYYAKSVSLWWANEYGAIAEFNDLSSLDIGASIGYYLSDSFFIELGGQYVTPFAPSDAASDQDPIIGISLGSSFRY